LQEAVTHLEVRIKFCRKKC